MSRVYPRRDDDPEYSLSFLIHRLHLDQDPAEELFWYSMRQLAAAYLSSAHPDVPAWDVEAYAAAYWRLTA